MMTLEVGYDVEKPETVGSGSALREGGEAWRATFADAGMASFNTEISRIEQFNAYVKSELAGLGASHRATLSSIAGELSGLGVSLRAARHHRAAPALVFSLEGLRNQVEASARSLGLSLSEDGSGRATGFGLRAQSTALRQLESQLSGLLAAIESLLARLRNGR